MTIITKCACGQRMSKYSRECRACGKVKAAAWQARIARVNASLGKPDLFVIQTFKGPYWVNNFRENCDAVCFPVGKTPDQYNQHTFALHGGHIAEAEKALGIV